MAKKPVESKPETVVVETPEVTVTEVEPEKQPDLVEAPKTESVNSKPDAEQKEVAEKMSTTLLLRKERIGR